MAWVMGRRACAWLIPIAVAACSDDVSESVAEEGTTTESTTSLDTTSAPDPSGISLTTFDTVTDSDVTSDVSTFTTDTDPSDTDPSDTDPSDTDPSDTDPSDTDPSDTDPSDTDPSDTDPSDTDPSDTDPSDTDPSDTDPSDTDPSTSTSDTDPSDSDPSITTTDPTDPSDTDPSDTDPSDTDPSDTDPSDTDPSTSTSDTDPTDTDPSDTDPSTSTSDTDTGGGGFSDPPPFGANVLDLDLVGIWSLNWGDPAAFDSILEVDASGNFIWTENTADCSAETVSTGFLWVEGAQIVMHVETWERQMPWDTEAAIGESYDVPFRLRLSFSLQGSGADDYLAIAAPARMTEAAPYTGESYIRLSTDGVHLGGEWRGEAELQAIPAGETDPVVVVRDTYRALLDPEAAPDVPEGNGLRATNTTYFPTPIAFDAFDGGNWTCLGGCSQPSGLTLVDGSNLYTYGPYGGQQHLLTFDSGRVFRSGFDTDCQ
jgi:hypothetical protein